MSHFRDVVASMVKSLKGQYDQILTDTIKAQVSRAMVKFQVELDILAQYVNSQNIVDTSPLEFDDFLEVQLNISGVQRPEEGQTATNSNLAVKDQNGNNNNTQGVPADQVKQEKTIANVVHNRRSSTISPMVRLGGDFKIYGMSTKKPLKVARRKTDGEPSRKVRAIDNETTPGLRSSKAGYSLKRFQCKYCPRKYRARQGLQFHVKAKHPKEGCEPPRFECDQCSSSYSYIGNLRIHQKKQHRNQSGTGTSDDHKK
ncbi:uncharacterized protein LOC119069069 isoform X2 [Bradysia coprophila]|uniref:uncharacterized protein LOC119069069 isoform X2 n=1 Tax=Bradysia coprophila TaxID=38358 RepID=UPI00187D84A9|nr:uncharacterized protein LOC119069069 isoform X2 [Bradysia coprophila]